MRIPAPTYPAHSVDKPRLAKKFAPRKALIANAHPQRMPAPAHLTYPGPQKLPYIVAMKRDLSLTAPTPVIAAAMQRRPGVRRRKRTDPTQGGRGGKKSENNFVAIVALSYGRNSGNRPGAGARPGNCNALRTGQHTAAARAVRKRWRQLFDEFDAVGDTVVAAHRAKIDLAPALRRINALVREACAR
jgi:hypothetical protein